MVNPCSKGLAGWWCLNGIHWYLRKKRHHQPGWVLRSFSNPLGCFSRPPEMAVTAGSLWIALSGLTTSWVGISVQVFHSKTAIVIISHRIFVVLEIQWCLKPPIIELETNWDILVSRLAYPVPQWLGRCPRCTSRAGAKEPKVTLIKRWLLMESRLISAIIGVTLLLLRRGYYRETLIVTFEAWWFTVTMSVICICMDVWFMVSGCLRVFQDRFNGRANDIRWLFSKRSQQKWMYRSLVNGMGKACLSLLRWKRLSSNTHCFHP